ncbi:hypothetical protein FO519_009059 [Halicephalobus sp. NKZ332]|nr:hypothetical protein FO519_009059 [Halicephalobus sp. NKZ332]
MPPTLARNRPRIVMTEEDQRVSVSILQYLGPANSGSCGYCKRGRRKTPGVSDNEEPSFSLGVIAHFLTCEDFNQMLDIGWNRSGKYLYKPIMDKTCCPQYTIRLDVNKFRLSRTQKRVLRNVHNYLRFGTLPSRKIQDPSLMDDTKDRTVHEDLNTSRKGYEGFLMATPLITPIGDPNVPALGSYHQQYVLDGKIIAVGVVDILPRCLSSKYFYYDPDYAFLTMGTYSALREIAYTQELAKTRPSLHYYYMGYYLQECPKMRYKGKFHPSDLLCDKTFKWMPLEEAVKKIIANDSKFTVFYPDEPRPPSPSYHSIRCMFRDRVMMYPKVREEMVEPRLSEFDTKMGELCHYMHKVISSVVIFFPSMAAYLVGADDEEEDEISGDA